MKRHRAYWPLDEAPVSAGEEFFVGVEQRAGGANNAPGYLVEADNCRCVNGELRTRPGIRAVRWLLDDGATPFISDPGTERICGACEFDDPNGERWIIVAAVTAGGDKVWRTRPGNVAVEIGLNGARLPATGDVNFTQCFNVLILWRGLDLGPLVLRTFDEGFIEPLQSAAGSGTRTLPNSDGSGCFWQNRVLAPFRGEGINKKDLIAVGDPGDYTRYVYPVAALRLNEGESDEVVRIEPFGKQTLLVFKGSRIYVVGGLVPDSVGSYPNAWADTLTKLHGLASQHGVVVVGRECYHLDETGLHTAQMTAQNEVQGLDLPLSAPIEMYWGRINWNYARGAQVAWHENDLYVAVPYGDEDYLLGPEVDFTGAVYQYDPAVGTFCYELTLVVGRRYRLACGANEGGLESGLGSSYAPGTFEFVADSTQYWLISSAEVEQPVTAVLQEEVRTGINNGVLVYSFVNKAWAGVWTAPNLAVKRWVTVDYQGRRRLVAVNEDGTLLLFGEGEEDETLEGIEPIAMRAVTRPLMPAGSGGADGERERKRYNRAVLRLAHWACKYSVAVVTEGVNERLAVVTEKEFNRVRYTRGGRADWDASNDHDDFEEPYREDYSVVLPETGMDLQGGCALDLEQSWEETVRLPDARGEGCKLEVSSSQGVLVVRGVRVEGVAGERDEGRRY